MGGATPKSTVLEYAREKRLPPPVFTIVSDQHQNTKGGGARLGVMEDGVEWNL